MKLQFISRMLDILASFWLLYLELLPSYLLLKSSELSYNFLGSLSH